MSKVNIQQSLAELEYLLSKYYDENFSKVLSTEKKTYDEKKTSAALNTPDMDYLTMMSAPNMVKPRDPKYDAEAEKWRAMHIDDLFDSVEKKVLSKRSVQQDITHFTESIRTLLQVQLGKAKYAELSKESDLATTYVHHFITSKMIDQCGKMGMPKSSLQYILERGCKQSFIGFLCSVGSSETEERVKESIERHYNPSVLEKSAGEAAAFGLDIATLGGYNIATKSGKVFVSIEGVARTYQVAKGYDDGDPFFKEFSKNVFGTTGALSKVRSQKITASENKDIHNYNAQLKNKLHLPKLELHIDDKELLDIKQRFQSQARGNGMKMAELVCNIFDQNGLKADSNKSVPGWMKQKSEKENIRQSSYFLALALEMKSNQKSAVKIADKQYSYETVCQRAFDYAHAAAEQRCSLEQVQQQEQTVAAAQYYNNMAQQMAVQQYQQQLQPVQQMIPQQVQKQQGNEGWNALLESLGLTGFGDIKKNLGYTLAMLPEILADMITGRSKNNKLKDNLFGLGVIFAAFFTRNKLLKLMLFMLGGASIINKASHSLADKSSAQPRVFKQYADEPLNARMKDVAIRGNTMLATIDGVPAVITLPDNAVTAFEKGKLPLNTLANAVLVKHDEQKADMASNYEHHIHQRENNNVGIR